MNTCKQPDTMVIRDDDDAGIDAGIEPYFTVAIPFVPREYATKWHPTEDKGPLALLTRGAFKTYSQAIAWAKAHLEGTLFAVSTRSWPRAILLRAGSVLTN